MVLALAIAVALVWAVCLVLGFLLIGVLQGQARLRWRVEQLEATSPRRVGRDGLKVGARAADFSLPDISGETVRLSDLAGRRVLLVFTQDGCAPCHRVMPELGRMAGRDLDVVVINNGSRAEGRKVSELCGGRVRVLTQEGFAVSRVYEAFATPFTFLIDEQGLVRSKGIVHNRRQIGFVLGDGAESADLETAATAAGNGKAH